MVKWIIALIVLIIITVSILIFGLNYKKQPKKIDIKKYINENFKIINVATDSAYFIVEKDGYKFEIILK